MLSQLLKYGALIFIFCLTKASYSQQREIKQIEKAIEEKNYRLAEEIFNRSTLVHFADKNADSLLPFTFYAGRVPMLQYGLERAKSQLLQFINKIANISNSARILRQAYLEAGEFYGSVGENHEAYQANKKALHYTNLSPQKSGNKLAMVLNNMSTYAQRTGDLHLSANHGYDALKYVLADGEPNYETLYISYNGLGSAMWYMSKADSAIHFYQLALEALTKTEETPVNRYYRTAIVNNNLAALHQMQGRTTAAITAMHATIDHLKRFIASGEAGTKKPAAIQFEYEAIENLAGIYKDLGNFTKTRELLEFTYERKKQEGAYSIFISEILLGQIYFALRDYDKAEQFLKAGIAKTETEGNENIFWRADGCNTLALLYDAKKEIPLAVRYYMLTDSLYGAALQGEYDNIYLEFLRNEALFYAENHRPKKARSIARKAYQYILNNQGEESLVTSDHLLNLANIEYLAGDFALALEYSNRSLATMETMASRSAHLLDSIRVQVKKPKAVLQKSKIAYALLEHKNEKNLAALLHELNEALEILEQQKTLLTEPSDIDLLIASHSELISFAKKITLELYEKTNKTTWFNRLLNLYESELYNRIRARLDKNDSVQFAHVSANLLQEEKTLKASMAAALRSDGVAGDRMQKYVQSNKQWNSFLQKIKREHPRYYNLRYASLFKNVGDFRTAIPENTTLVRYLFVEDKLYALVADTKNYELVQLKPNHLPKKIRAITSNSLKEKDILALLFDLHQQLWLPLRKNIEHKKIIIIPDGILYHLNFEILTPKAAKSYRELSTKSLLYKYTISYHYSLFLLNKNHSKAAPAGNFIAFAPGFSGRAKNNYLSKIKDTFNIDHAYMNLIPQPFSLQLVKKMKNFFSGKSYVEEQSTKSSFRQFAGNHKIIHISTHAEANNENPGYSRLIFSKYGGANTNHLLADEIYNCDLTSNLAVLTGCETGKPGYRDGEGMISFAHAFHYAGSESIITGLWKIDEQASAIILENFYKRLMKGLPKDEALQQAKLQYLETARGRMLAPQYWAGLVIMGDTAPIEMQSNIFSAENIWIWMTVAVVVLMAAIWYWRKRRPKRKAASEG